MYKCDHFEIYELVSKEVYDKYGEFAWHFFDARLLKIADFLQQKFGTCTVNDWKWGGNFKSSGLRGKDSLVGASFSQHRFGRALDMKFKNYSAKDVRKWLKANWTEKLSKKLFGEVIQITVENDVSWLHLSVQNNKKVFNIFNP